MYLLSSTKVPPRLAANYNASSAYATSAIKSSTSSQVEPLC